MAGAPMPALVRTLQPLPPPLLLEWRFRRRRRQHVVVVAAAEMAVVHRPVRQHNISSFFLSLRSLSVTLLSHTHIVYFFLCLSLPLFNSVSLSLFTGVKDELFLQWFGIVCVEASG